MDKERWLTPLLKLTSVRASLLGRGALRVLGSGRSIGVPILVLRRGSSIGDGAGPGPCWRSARGPGRALGRHFLPGRAARASPDPSDASNAPDASRRPGDGDHRASARGGQGRGREHVRHGGERADARQPGPGHGPVPGLYFQTLARRGEGRRAEGPEPTERQTVIQRVEKLGRQVEHMMEAVAERCRGAERYLEILRVGHLDI